MLCQFWGFNSGDFKNDLYFHFIVPTTPARAMAPPGGGLGEARGGFSPILSKIMCYIDSRVFILGYPQPPQGRPPGGEGPEGGLVVLHYP